LVCLFLLAIILSLIDYLGNCWRQLPLDEKRVWEKRAKEEKEKHKIQYPDYRFKPVHNKNKKSGLSSTSTSHNSSSSTSSGPHGSSSLGNSGGRKEKPQQTREEELRCDQVAQLLLEGKKGEELARAVRVLDRQREARERELDLEHEMGDESATSSRAQSVMQSPMPGFHAQLQMPSQLPASQFYQNHNPQYTAGLMLRRPSSVPLPMFTPTPGSGSDNWGFAPQQQQQGSIAIPSIPYISNHHHLSRPASPSPLMQSFMHQPYTHPGNQFIHPDSASRMSFGLSRRPSSAQAIFGFGGSAFMNQSSSNAQMNGNNQGGAYYGMLDPNMNMGGVVGATGRRSWTMPLYGDILSQGASMPFFDELGIENPFAPVPQHQQQVEDVEETAGEPDYALFNGFSFSAGGPTPTTNVAEEAPAPVPASTVEARNSPVVITAHDLPPLDLSHAGWTSSATSGPLDMDQISSAPPSASVSASSGSHASSPEPAEYTPTNGNATYQQQQGGYADMVSPFDMPLDPLSVGPMMGMPVHHQHHHQVQGHGHTHSHSHSHDMSAYIMTESYDGFSSSAMDMEMEMDAHPHPGTVMHAPKPITPTSNVFGGQHQQHQQQQHGQQEEAGQYFEPGVYLEDEFAL